jgi:GH43 family beta-xylosidase
MILVLAIVFASSVAAQEAAPLPGPDRSGMFTNPIAEHGHDPWVILKDGWYYYCRVIPGNRIAVSRTRHLPLIDRTPRSVVWSPPPNTPYSHNVWAPELHYLQGAWYIYFAADDGRNENHRMYVLEGTTQDPLDPFEFRGQITDPTNRWAIDGTVLKMPVAPASGRCTGGTPVPPRLYFIWSGWEGTQNVQQNLYIAPMRDPLAIDGPRVLISEPEHPWERIGSPRVNEGPQVLWSPDGEHLHIIYSASGSWTDDYCLGRLTWTGGDVLDRASWVKHPEPVFRRTERVFGPGHASFTTSHGRLQHWIVYHAAKRQGSGWDRDVRTQRFSWRRDGTPDFGTPLAPGVPIRWGWEPIVPMEVGPAP